MEINITLLTFRGCPNADPVREVLRKLGIAFRDVLSDDLPQSHPWRAYSSPTILQNDKIVFGTDQGGDGACSLNVPTEEFLKDRLVINKIKPAPRNGKPASLLSFIGSIGSAVTVGLCPVCIPAIGVLLSAIGMGFLAQEAVLKPLLISLLAFTVAGLAWSWIKEHRRPGALLAGAVSAVLLYTGRYVYFGGTINEVMELIGMGGLIAATLWNLKLRRQAGCSSCRIDAQKQRA